MQTNPAVHGNSNPITRTQFLRRAAATGLAARGALSLL